MQGALLRAGYTASRVHYGHEAMTDMTLGAMQDSGWCATTPRVSNREP